ncbi:MAG: type I-E CRISPR-associated protein Cse1/CasA [Deltaproteobacteria bacterium]|nr:type I-E CRISPR-associated protein Cse1/CasA [Deltaproteobacteria bacterium]
MTASFNLTTKSWIPCVDLNGRPRELSLLELFAQAQQLRGIEDDNPLVVASLHRLLLAIVHRAVNGPKNVNKWKELWDMGRFSDAVRVYLLKKDINSRFDLFSKDHPFYQTAGFENLSVKKDKEPTIERKNISKLNIALSSGGNKTLFDHNLESEFVGFTPSECARFLLVAQNYSFSGLAKTSVRISEGSITYQGNFYNSHLVGHVMVLLIGSNLFETIMLNTLIYKEEKPNSVPTQLTNDSPIWEKGSKFLATGKRKPAGYLEFLTWKSRHVRLIPEMQDNRVLVRYMFFGQAEELDSVDDPLCWYVSHENGSKQLRLTVEKAYWRDSGALFQFALENEKVPPYALKQLSYLLNRRLLQDQHNRAIVIGLANEQAKPLLWRQELFPVPSVLLQNKEKVMLLSFWLEHAEKSGWMLRQAVVYFVAYLLNDDVEKVQKLASSFIDENIEQRSAVKTFKVPQKYQEILRKKKSMSTERQFWIRMEPLFYEFMRELSSDVNFNEWKKRVADLALNVFSETTVNSLCRSIREIKAGVLARKILNGKIHAILTSGVEGF